ncbi:MAG: efflux RND transporter permease subunit, partial [Planctomycetes bacterium]|nr:efflux RND transporter permease subunit [Planctomycetota bacterium]
MGKRHPIIGTFAKRPVSLLVLIFATMLIGFLVTIPIPGITVERVVVALMPNGFESRDIRVEVPLSSRDTNLSPAQIEKEITLPIEGELATIPGIERLSSESDRNEASFRLTFAKHIDLDDAFAQVRDRVERAKRLIKADIGQPRMRRWSGASMPISYLAVRFDEDVERPFDKLQNRIMPALESIDGVSDVQIWGDVSPYYRIALKKDKMGLYNLGDLISHLSGDNFSKPVGQAEIGDSKAYLVVDSRFRTLDQLKNYPVSESLALKDVADVYETASSSSVVFSYAWEEDKGHFTGGRGVFLPIYKNSDANTVSTCAALTRTIEELGEDPTLKGVSYFSAFNQGDEIVSQLLILLETVAIGGALAVLVLLIFLKRLRLALIIALSIPLSMTMALLVMYFMGEIVSLFTLMGFTIVAGMLLDNAIVVSENIYRRFDIDASHQAAAVAGAGEVGMALTLATSTTIIVFFALWLVGDDPTMMTMLTALGYPICFSLIFSVFVALAVIPYTMGRVFGGVKRSDRLEVRERYHRSFRKIYRLPVLGRVASFPLALFFGRPPEIQANTSIGDWIDSRPTRRRIVFVVAMLVSVAGAWFFANWVFSSLGGESFWEPILKKFEAEEKSGGRGSWGGFGGKQEVGPFP